MSQITIEDNISEVPIIITKIFAFGVSQTSSHDQLSICIMEKIQLSQLKYTKFSL